MFVLAITPFEVETETNFNVVLFSCGPPSSSLFPRFLIASIPNPGLVTATLHRSVSLRAISSSLSHYIVHAHRLNDCLVANNCLAALSCRPLLQSHLLPATTRVNPQPLPPLRQERKCRSCSTPFEHLFMVCRHCSARLSIY